MRLALLAAIACCCITACGQKGSLYLRDQPPSGVKPAKPPIAKPAPYPAEAADEAGAKN